MCNIDNCFNIHSKCFLVLNKLTSAKILFETLAYSSAPFQDTKRCFFFPADTLQKADKIYRARCFAYSCISSEIQLIRLRIAVNAISYFTDCPSSLVFKRIYHRSTSFPSKYTIESMVYCLQLPLHYGTLLLLKQV